MSSADAGRRQRGIRKDNSQQTSSHDTLATASEHQSARWRRATELSCGLQCEHLQQHVLHTVTAREGKRHRGEDERCQTCFDTPRDESARLPWREDRHALQQHAGRLLVVRPVAWVAAGLEVSQ